MFHEDPGRIAQVPSYPQNQAKKWKKVMSKNVIINVLHSALYFLPYALGIPILLCYSSLPNSWGNKAAPGFSNTKTFGSICHIPVRLWFELFSHEDVHYIDSCNSLPGATPGRSCTWGPVQMEVQGGSTLPTHYFRGIKCTALGGNRSSHNSYCSFLISVCFTVI